MIDRCRVSSQELAGPSLLRLMVLSTARILWWRYPAERYSTVYFQLQLRLKSPTSKQSPE